MNSIGLLIAGACCFGAGVGTGWVIKPTAGEEVVQRSQDVLSASRLDRIAHQLVEIRAAIDSPQRRPPETQAEPTRTSETNGGGTGHEDLRAHLDARLDIVLAEIRQGLAGIDELARLKPAPDKASFSALRKEFDADQSAAVNRLSGMSYRDATRSFGVPTRKISVPNNVHGPKGGPLVIWIWELPDSNTEFMLSFDSDVACWGKFGSLGALTKYATELGHE